MADLPVFPDFRPFSIDDADWYYDFYVGSKLNPYVDVHTENLLIWLNLNNDLMISRIGDATIVFKYTNPLNNNQLNVLPLSKNLTNETIEMIMSHLWDNDFPHKIQEIPSTICHDLCPQKWGIADYRDGYEYMLDTKEQSELSTSEFSRQRRRIHFFEKEHENDKFEIEYYDEFNDEAESYFIHHLETMPLNCKVESADKNTIEPFVIRRNLKLARVFHKKALVIKMNGKVVSLSMISMLDKDTASINHLKVDYTVQYIFQYTIYQLAKKFQELGVKEMNLEQDLGLEGLRTFKERLKPSRLLEKKVITPRYQ